MESCFVDWSAAISITFIDVSAGSDQQLQNDDSLYALQLCVVL